MFLVQLNPLNVRMVIIVRSDKVFVKFVQQEVNVYLEHKHQNCVLLAHIVPVDKTIVLSVQQVIIV